MIHRGLYGLACLCSLWPEGALWTLAPLLCWFLCGVLMRLCCFLSYEWWGFKCAFYCQQIHDTLQYNHPFWVRFKFPKLILCFRFCTWRIWRKECDIVLNSFDLTLFMFSSFCLRCTSKSEWRWCLRIMKLCRQKDPHLINLCLNISKYKLHKLLHYSVNILWSHFSLSIYKDI